MVKFDDFFNSTRKKRSGERSSLFQFARVHGCSFIIINKAKYTEELHDQKRKEAIDLIPKSITVT